MFEEKPPIIVELEGRDRLCRQSKMGKMEVQLVGCHELLMMVKKLREQHGDDPVKWPVPEGQCHLTGKSKWYFVCFNRDGCPGRQILARYVWRANEENLYSF